MATKKSKSIKEIKLIWFLNECPHCGFETNIKPRYWTLGKDVCENTNNPCNFITDCVSNLKTIIFELKSKIDYYDEDY